MNIINDKIIVNYSYCNRKYYKYEYVYYIIYDYGESQSKYFDTSIIDKLVKYLIYYKDSLDNLDIIMLGAYGNMEYIYIYFSDNYIHVLNKIVNEYNKNLLNKELEILRIIHNIPKCNNDFTIFNVIREGYLEKW